MIEPQTPDAETSSACTILVSTDGKFVEVSDLFCKLIGYTRDELVGMKHEDLIAPGTADRPTTDAPQITSGCSQGLWLLTTRAGIRMLVDYESRTRVDLLIQTQMEVVGAGY